MSRPLALHSRRHTLSAADISRLDNAHAVICNEWGTIRVAIHQIGLMPSLARNVELINEYLDQILDVVKEARGVESYADLDDTIEDIDTFLNENTPQNKGATS